MHVIIIGAGEVGYHTADRLSREGHEVTVVETDPAKQRLLEERINAMVVQGSGASSEALEQAGITRCDLFIAVTDQDEVNLIACILANEYNVPRKIARVKSVEFTEEAGRFNPTKLGIDLVINPEAVVADEIMNITAYTSAVDAAEFADGRVVFLGYPITEGSELVGLTLRELGEMRGIYRLVVVAITRGRDTVVPRGADRIEAGDIVYFVCHRKDLPAIQYLFGLERTETRNVFILGGGRVGAELGRRMIELGYRVKIIDRNPEHARSLAHDLAKALVLETSGTDMDTLRNEGIEKADAYVAVTQDEQSNILCSLLAKRHGARRAIALVDHQEFVAMAPALGVDACISPRLATAAAILKHVRRGEVLSMAMVEQCNAEVVEFGVPESAPVAGKSLSVLDVPRGANIGAIVRGDKVIIPGGQDSLEVDDHVIVFALPEAVAEVETFFGGK